jgi:hypothetical protein
MIINWYGQTCFRITVPRGRDGQVTILIDPFDKETGLRSPRAEADILLFTSPQKKNYSKDIFLVTGPGEYDIKDLYIQGIVSSQPEKTIYTIEAKGIKICHLGTLKQSELNNKEIELIGEVDILLLPVGGKEALDAKEAVKVMSQIEPKIIIPMYYKIPGLKNSLDTLDTFLKSLGIKKTETLPKLSIKRKDILAEEAKIIVLSP